MQSARRLQHQAVFLQQQWLHMRALSGFASGSELRAVLCDEHVRFQEVAQVRAPGRLLCRYVETWTFAEVLALLDDANRPLWPSRLGLAVAV